MLLCQARTVSDACKWSSNGLGRRLCRSLSKVDSLVLTDEKTKGWFGEDVRHGNKYSVPADAGRAGRKAAL